jgi:hypothetical protein
MAAAALLRQSSSVVIMDFVWAVCVSGSLLAGNCDESTVAPAEVLILQAPDDSSQPAEQENPEGKKPPTPPHTGVHALLSGLKEDILHLPSKPNLYIALAGGGAAAALHPFDQTFNVHLRSHYTLVNDIYAPGKYYGDTPEQVALSLGTYVVGRVFDYPKVSHLGMDLLRAQLIAELLVQPVKLATHRLRPDGSNYQSFPSGHAAVTFAGATVLERHLGWKKATLAYGIAAYVASSRMHDNVHYLSDVVFGSALGVIAGRTVAQHGRNVWTFAPAPVRGGAAVFVMRDFTSGSAPKSEPPPNP